MSNRKRKIELLAQREKLSFSYNSNTEEVNLNRLPKSIDEAKSYSNFWGDFLDEHSNEVEKITFSYQEKSTRIPLTKLQRVRNYFGSRIKPQEKEGEIKEYTITPVSVSNDSGLAKIINNKKEFGVLSSLSKTTQDFATNYIFMLEPLCYRTFVPLELVTKVKLKGDKD